MKEALTCNTEDQMSIECAESPQYYEMSNPDGSGSSENQNSQDVKSTKAMESSTRPSTSVKTTSKNLFEYSALESSGVSQKLLNKLPAYLFKQETPQLNENLLLDDGVGEEEDEVVMPLMQLEARPPLVEPQREQRTAKAGRRGFLFKADAVAAKQEEH